ncbi:hypothetical protein FNB79_08500 [Formosa sediminum]|uniref:Uncharacterized protein n=1 Tax=Formosa sediminum TaxID=2594004 RepID=A0A516GRM8_9FLAO|nr:hypothetical protein [Formosa sediminum]QDO94020.1 hypothetical protein FNB79_08500 [Formosa sediminum]
MVVDADDLISNKIASFVNKQKTNAPGWYINKGYYYKEGTNYLFLNKKTFNNLCGSCLIVRTDLFLKLIVNDPWLYYYHELMELPGNIKSQAIPFSGALYSMANGENHFMSSEHAIKLMTKQKISYKQNIINLYNKFLKYIVRPLTPNFKKNFGFYKV